MDRIQDLLEFLLPFFLLLCRFRRLHEWPVPQVALVLLPECAVDVERQAALNEEGVDGSVAQ